MPALHKDLVDGDLHKPGWVQASDPGAVGAGRLWIDTSGGSGAWRIKVRNAGDSGWETLGGSGAAITGATIDDTPIGQTTPAAGAFTTLAGTSLQIADANFTAALSGGNPRLTFDTDDYQQFDRANDRWQVHVAGSEVIRFEGQSLSVKQNSLGWGGELILAGSATGSEGGQIRLQGAGAYTTDVVLDRYQDNIRLLGGGPGVINRLVLENAGSYFDMQVQDTLKTNQLQLDGSASGWTGSQAEILHRNLQTTNNTATEIHGISVAEGEAVVCYALAVALRSTFAEFSWHFGAGGAYRPTGGNVSLGSTTPSVGNNDNSSGAPVITFVADTTGQKLSVRVTGETSKTFNWAVSLWFVKVRTSS